MLFAALANAADNVTVDGNAAESSGNIQLSDACAGARRACTPRGSAIPGANTCCRFDVTYGGVTLSAEFRFTS